MEVRELYVARLMKHPEEFGVSEVKFIHAPHIILAHSTRLRCQYLCAQQRQSTLCPPFSPTQQDTARTLEEYRFGLMLRREVPPGGEDAASEWRRFHDAVIEAEGECFRRGYSKAFAVAIGNCVYQHLDDSARPCDYPSKSRPTLEAVGVNLTDTLDLLGWDRHVVREPGEPLQMFALLLLE